MINPKFYLVIALLFGFVACEKPEETNNEPAYYPAPQGIEANGTAEFVLNGRISTSQVFMNLTQDTLKGISAISAMVFLNGRSYLEVALESNTHYMGDIVGNIPNTTVYTIGVNEGYKNPNDQYLVKTLGQKNATTEESAFLFSDNYCSALKLFVDKVDTTTGEVNLSTPYLEFCDEDLQRVIFEDFKISAIN